jgi:hypothetical protein
VDVLHDVQHVHKGFGCLAQVMPSANAILEALEASPGLEHQALAEVSSWCSSGALSDEGLGPHRRPGSSPRPDSHSRSDGMTVSNPAGLATNVMPPPGPSTMRVERGLVTAYPVPPEHGEAEPMVVCPTPLKEDAVFCVAAPQPDGKTGLSQDGNTGLSQDGNSCTSPDEVPPLDRSTGGTLPRRASLWSIAAEGRNTGDPWGIVEKPGGNGEAADALPPLELAADPPSPSVARASAQAKCHRSVSSAPEGRESALLEPKGGGADALGVTGVPQGCGAPERMIQPDSDVDVDQMCTMEPAERRDQRSRMCVTVLEKIAPESSKGGDQTGKKPMECGFACVSVVGGQGGPYETAGWACGERGQGSSFVSAQAEVCILANGTFRKY